MGRVPFAWERVTPRCYLFIILFISLFIAITLLPQGSLGLEIPMEKLLAPAQPFPGEGESLGQRN